MRAFERSFWNFLPRATMQCGKGQDARGKTIGLASEIPPSADPGQIWAGEGSCRPWARSERSRPRSALALSFKPSHTCSEHSVRSSLNSAAQQAQSIGWNRDEPQGH